MLVVLEAVRFLRNIAACRANGCVLASGLSWIPSGARETSVSLRFRFADRSGQL